MKKLMMAAAVGAAISAAAMPDRKELIEAQPVVAKLSAETVRKLGAGELSPGEGADAMVALAEGASGEAQKFLLLNGALRLRMRSGEIAAARKIVEKLRAAVKGLTAEQLNALLLEETPNCYAAWFTDETDGEKIGSAAEGWHIKAVRASRGGLTVRSLDELGKCDRSRAVRVYLRGEKGVADADLSGLSCVVELDLSETGITEIPAQVFRMKNLRRLWLARNPISSVPDAIGNLKLLVYLNLDGTAVSKVPEALAKLADLRYLRMNGTKLDYMDDPDALDGILSRIPNLRRFYARNTRISKMPGAGCAQLTDLDVGGTKIASIDRDDWGRLQRISFAGCTGLERFPEKLPVLGYSAQVLDISKTPLAGNTAETERICRGFDSIPGLVVIDIQ